MKKKNRHSIIPIDLVRDAQDSMIMALSKDSRYSIEPDPTGALKLSEDQKNFLRAYIDFKNIPLAAQMAGIDETTAKLYFMDPTCRGEIRRINLALYYRKFSRRLLTIDELGGYLTSMLIDEDMGEADKLSSKDKLTVTKQIMELNKLKAEAYNNPRVIENVNYEEQIQDLTPDQLKKLIETTTNPSKETKEELLEIDKQKQDLIDEINREGYLDPSEIALLKSCTIEELQKLKNAGDSENNDS